MKRKAESKEIEEFHPKKQKLETESIFRQSYTNLIIKVYQKQCPEKMDKIVNQILPPYVLSIVCFNCFCFFLHCFLSAALPSSLFELVAAFESNSMLFSFLSGKNKNAPRVDAKVAQNWTF